MKYLDTTTFSVILLLCLLSLLIVSGLKTRPGIGIIGTIVIMSITMWLRGDKFTDIGLQAPVSWVSTILQGLGYGIVIFFLSSALIDPLSELITKTTLDYGPVSRIKGHWLALVQTLVFVWLFVAVIEETIFRGFLMTEVSKVIGFSGTAALIFNIVFTSLVFGFCHAYQNSCGIISTALIGVLFAGIYLSSGKNLWVTIFTHGFLDTIAVFSIYFGFDERLRQLLWRS